MDLFLAILAGILAVAFPIFIVVLKYRVHRPWTRKINPLIACYVGGIVIGNTGISNSTTFSVLNNISTASVVLSLPLLLFSTNVRKLGSVGVRVLGAMGLGACAVLAATTLSHLLFRHRLNGDSWKVTALVIAVLTGGTPNMASARAALGIESSLYVVTHTSEVIVGAFYVLAVMTVAKPILLRVLKPFAAAAPAAAIVHQSEEEEEEEMSDAPYTPAERACGTTDTELKGQNGGASSGGDAADTESVEAEPVAVVRPEGDAEDEGLEAEAQTARDMMRLQKGVEPYAEMVSRAYRRPLLGAVGLDLCIVLVSAAAGLPFAGLGYFELVTILLITTLSITAACSDRVRSIRHTFTAGQSLILVFCTAVGMLADVRLLASTSPWVFVSVLLSMTLGVVLHIILAKLAGYDVDTLIVSSISLYCSPPFVGLACQSVGNTELLLPGISAGLVGYAAGNYLGSGMGTLWKNTLP